jgi:pSer/pThr/pTyr-binding forkhead associated (FHA) protein
MGVNTIGRRSKTSDCAIQLDTADEFISRRHARIELRRNADGAYEYLLTDADSRNGTFLNEQRLYKDETVFLALGDRIRLGHTTFILS